MDNASALLRQHNLRVTCQRVAVYKALRAIGHASAEEVYNNIKQFKSL